METIESQNPSKMNSFKLEHPDIDFTTLMATIHAKQNGSTPNISFQDVNFIIIE